MLTNLHVAKCLAFLATLLMMLIPASSWGTNYTSWNADSINTKLGACAQLRNTVIDTTINIAVPDPRNGPGPTFSSIRSVTMSLHQRNIMALMAAGCIIVGG